MPATEQKLKDKVAIITGSSRGMGRAAALLFAENGAKVVVNYQSDEEGATKTVNAIKKKGGSAIAIRANVGKMEDLPKLIDGCVNEFGGLDILYHNAGLHYVCQELDDITEKIWDDTYDVIVKGAFFLTKLAIPHLKKSGEGVILFTSSSSAGTSVPVDPHYMTAKNAVNLLYKILTGWLAPDIRVNCIIPGLIKTHMFRHHPPEVWEAFRNTLPMGRMGTPMDIAHAALFLCSPEANYLTGVAIPVDGGRTAATPRKAIMSSVTKMKAGETRYDESLYSEEDLKDIEVGL